MVFEDQGDAYFLHNLSSIVAENPSPTRAIDSHFIRFIVLVIDKGNLHHRALYGVSGRGLPLSYS